MRAVFGSNAAMQNRDFATHAYLAVDGVRVDTILQYNPLMGASWDQDIDNPVGGGQVSVDLGGRSGITSPWHSQTAVLDGRPLFDVGRYLTIWTATTERGANPTDIDWRNAFDARIDDYDPAASSDDTLSIVCRDRMCDLLDGWIKNTLVDTGNANIDLALYALLTAAFPVPPFALLTDPTPGPSFFVSTYTQDPMSCLEAMRRLALNTGWDLRGRYGVSGLGADEFGLVLSGVERSLTNPSYSFAPWRYDRPSRMLVSRNTVRNYVRVIPNTADRTPIDVSDAASINLYGERFLQLSEDRTSHIDTDPEGTDLANYALSDLKDPKAEWVVPMPYWFPAELHDRYEFQPAADGVHFDQATTLAVSGYRHTLAGGEGRTELRLRRNAAAANREWRSVRPQPIKASLTEPAGPLRENDVWLQYEAP